LNRSNGSSSSNGWNDKTLNTFTISEMKQNSDKAKEYLIINVKVEPRSSKSGIAGPYGNAIKVKLKSPPVEGKANKELIEILAKEFGIAKTDIDIISGKSSRNKIVKLYGVRNLEDVVKKDDYSATDS
jgi:uncharacterized protein (TIGR00251 family)